MHCNFFTPACCLVNFFNTSRKLKMERSSEIGEKGVFPLAVINILLKQAYLLH